MCLKRPVYRGFRCEGKYFYPHTYPHTPTLPAGKHPACCGFYGWASMKQWFKSNGILRVLHRYTPSMTYTALSVQGCCTIGARVLHYRCKGAALLVQGCCTFWVPFVVLNNLTLTRLLTACRRYAKLEYKGKRLTSLEDKPQNTRLNPYWHSLHLVLQL